MTANQQSLLLTKAYFSVLVDFARFDNLVVGGWNLSALLLVSLRATHYVNKTVKSVGNLSLFASYLLHQLDFDKLFSIRQGHSYDPLVDAAQNIKQYR